MKAQFAFFVFLLASQAFAQTAPAQSQAPAPKKSAAATASAKPLAPDAAVITVDGVCKAPSSRAAECKTVISRAEFERLMSLLSRQRNGEVRQTIPAEAKRQLAIQYSRLLLFADVAEKQGLQNTTEARELIRFVRLQAMTEELARTLQQKAAPTPKEIQQYYDQHLQRYTRWDLQRVVVPMDPKAENQPNKQELKKLAEDLRQRASNGADFDGLQKEVYEKLGRKNPPAAKLAVMPGTSLPEAHAEVYRLKPGELSPVIEDPAGFYFYKLDSSTVVPLDRSKADIQDLLVGQKVQEAIRRIAESNKVTLNPDYFEAADQNAASKTPVQPIGGTGRAEVR